MGEVRVMAEGTLRIVQASGSGNTWATGTSPGSALIAFVQAFSLNSALTDTVIMERGRPSHHKNTEFAPIDVTFDCLWTGQFTGWATAAGASVPMVHAEWRASAPEIGTTGYYYQFYGLNMGSMKITEDKAGNKLSLSFKALGMSGANTSGYLS